MTRNTAAILLIALCSYGKSIAQCGTDPSTATTLSVAAANTIINSYFPGTGSPAIGATSVTMGTINAAGAATALAAGDLVMIMQMQGVDINSTNSDIYGDGVAGAPGSGQLSTNLVAGVWEYANVASVAGSTITLSAGIVNAYFTRVFTTSTSIQSYQVIRIPRYYTINIPATFSITCAPWNGSSGGVVALDASNTMTINGSVLANARGFRGGGGFRWAATGTGNTSAPPATVALNNADYRWNSPVTTTGNTTGGAKGEGIAGTPLYTLTTGSITTTVGTIEGYIGGSMGRGAPGNAGGGSTDGLVISNSENSGGGGGSNYGAGGNGGNSWNSNLAVGGNGGAAFTSASIRRMLMGGGGGAGSANDATVAQQYQASGATGGGIILIRAANFAGTGILNADGGDAVGVTATGMTDAGGGGGGGGTIIAVTRTNTTVGLTGVTAFARGGRGGNMETYFNHGPGGGGGGGLIVSNGTFAAASSVIAGTNGLTRTGTQTGTLDNAYGASPGTAGARQTLSNAPIIRNAAFAASPCGVLPINITGFGAVLDGSAVTLNWTTAQAIGFDQFDVEWSTNGSSWQRLSSLDFVETQAAYQYVHSPVTASSNYYRLKLIDQDGRYIYSSTVFVQLQPAGSGLKVYPQPAHGRFQVSVSVERSQQGLFRIFNASGVQVHQANVQLNRGVNAFVIDGLDKLSPGVYVLKSKTDGKEVTSKLVIN